MNPWVVLKASNQQLPSPDRDKFLRFLYIRSRARRRISGKPIFGQN